MAPPILWAIVIIMLHGLNGPQSSVMINTGPFENRAACEAKIAESVPAKLDAKAKAEWEEGYRQFVCVRVEE